ncbi:hypothetical protein ElyMa_003702600, partial [Elysia marginata]
MKSAERSSSTGISLTRDIAKLGLLFASLLFIILQKPVNGAVSFRSLTKTRWMERDVDHTDDLKWADRAYGFLQRINCSYFTFSTAA